MIPYLLGEAILFSNDFKHISDLEGTEICSTFGSYHGPTNYLVHLNCPTPQGVHACESNSRSLIS